MNTHLRQQLRGRGSWTAPGQQPPALHETRAHFLQAAYPKKRRAKEAPCTERSSNLGQKHIFKAQLQDVLTAENTEPDNCLGFTRRIPKGVDRRCAILERKGANYNSQRSQAGALDK